jgi:hypothetical protein
MCRVPKVVLVAPEDVRTDLRRSLSSLEYEIVAAVESIEETQGITFDVAVLWEPDAPVVAAARERGVKTVALGGENGADLQLPTEDAASFKTRVWELFRPA